MGTNAARRAAQGLMGSLFLCLLLGCEPASDDNRQQAPVPRQDQPAAAPLDDPVSPFEDALYARLDYPQDQLSFDDCRRAATSIPPQLWDRCAELSRQATPGDDTRETMISAAIAFAWNGYRDDALEAKLDEAILAHVGVTESDWQQALIAMNAGFNHWDKVFSERAPGLIDLDETRWQQANAKFQEVQQRCPTCHMLLTPIQRRLELAEQIRPLVDDPSAGTILDIAGDLTYAEKLSLLGNYHESVPSWVAQWHDRTAEAGEAIEGWTAIVYKPQLEDLGELDVIAARWRTSPTLIRYVNPQVEGCESDGCLTYTTLLIPIPTRSILLWEDRQGLPILPIDPGRSYVSSLYGRRVDPINGTWSFHAGIDIETREGEPALSTLHGTVSIETRPQSQEVRVRVTEANRVAEYYHGTAALVDEEQVVSPGTEVLATGSRGRSLSPHLHYQVRLDGETVDPILTW